ncbi:MAG: hypothetical protein BWX70_03062 [Verrucomicrobia bacterium ADurb.Bin070]|nr:MAG: hypothetical protein BWX70_03062 [Verrucomicrobia bacterium ADurb.Bin070]
MRLADRAFLQGGNGTDKCFRTCPAEADRIILVVASGVLPAGVGVDVGDAVSCGMGVQIEVIRQRSRADAAGAAFANGGCAIHAVGQRRHPFVCVIALSMQDNRVVCRGQAGLQQVAVRNRPAGPVVLSGQRIGQRRGRADHIDLLIPDPSVLLLGKGKTHGVHAGQIQIGNADECLRSGADIIDRHSIRENIGADFTKADGIFLVDASRVIPAGIGVDRGNGVTFRLIGGVQRIRHRTVGDGIGACRIGGAERAVGKHVDNQRVSPALIQIDHEFRIAPMRLQQIAGRHGVGRALALRDHRGRTRSQRKKNKARNNTETAIP